MSDSPLMIAVAAIAALYVLKLWSDDYRAFRRGSPNPRGLPGATPVQAWIIWLAVAGSVGLVAIETAGEYALGVSGEQSTIKAWYLIAMISAGVLEEVLFRGFLVVTRHGRPALIWSIVGFSLLFSLLHAHLFAGGGDVADPAGAAAATTAAFGLPLKLDLSPAALWWTFILFANAVWWYTMRFLPANAHKSLLPCFAGHIASNLAVFGIKLAQGYVAWH